MTQREICEEEGVDWDAWQAELGPTHAEERDEPAKEGEAEEVDGSLPTMYPSPPGPARCGCRRNPRAGSATGGRGEDASTDRSGPRDRLNSSPATLPRRLRSLALSSAALPFPRLNEDGRR